MDINTYTRACLELARSVRIYHGTVAKQVLNYYQLNRLGWVGCSDAEDHPYVCHLRGLAAQTDNPVSMVSIDTGLSFVLSANLSAHPKTRQRLQVDHEYFMKVAVGLGEFGYERLIGFVYPYTGPVPLKNGTIIGYDKTLVEERETSLIDDIQEWIYRSLHRWTNSGYIASDELYGAAIHGILYAHLPAQIMNLRDVRVQTQEVHSFHVDHYLADHGFADAVPYLMASQKYSIYKHIPWLMEHRGTEQVYQFYKAVLEMDVTVTVDEYYTKLDIADNHVQIFKKGSDSSVNIPVSEMVTATDQSSYEIYQQLSHGEVLDNLPQITVHVAGDTGLFSSLKRTLLYAWGWYSAINVYVDTLQIELPNGSMRALSTSDAYLYYIIHRPMTLFTQAYDSDIFLLPFIQDVSGHTGQDLFEFVSMDRVDNKQFHTYIEQIHFDMSRLRALIQLTPIDERVYWEGEFPRVYGTMASIIPNKTEWLTEKNLPELTDEYLDKIFDTYTGYSLTTEAQRKNKAVAYRRMLNSVLSYSSHLTIELDYNTSHPFISVPHATELGLTVVPDAFQLVVRTYRDAGSYYYINGDTLLPIQVTITGPSGVVYTGSTGGTLTRTLPSGNYTVLVTSHAGYVLVPLGTGATANVLPASKSVSTVLESNVTMNFGFAANVPANATYKGHVWEETGGNTLYNVGEPLLSGITVTLKNSYGNIIATQVTAAGTGAYSFSVVPGTYYVECFHPSGFTPIGWNAAALGNKLFNTGRTGNSTIAALGTATILLGFVAV